MTIHYHGTPISPVAALYELAGRHFCVSFARPDDVKRVHMIGQSVMLDNGAYSAWKRDHEPDWHTYYAWCERWLEATTTWAVIPDVIDAGGQLQDALLAEWPHGDRGAPVWHMDEPIERLLALVDAWPLVCVGSTAEYAKVLSDPWRRRQDELWNALSRRGRWLPKLHMLRGMQLAGSHYPYHSLDSTNVAQNHHRAQNTPGGLAATLDALQCRAGWLEAEVGQMELL